MYLFLKLINKLVSLELINKIIQNQVVLVIQF